jgi:hypothetical protein
MHVTSNYNINTQHACATDMFFLKWKQWQQCFLQYTFLIHVQSKKQIMNVIIFYNDIPGKVQKDISQTYKIQYSKGTKIPHTYFCPLGSYIKNLSVTQTYK